MGYSSKIEAFQRVEPLLEFLAEGERYEFEAENPNTLAFNLRQGLFAAAANDIQPYASLSYRFLVRPNCVIAEPKGAASDTPIGTRAHRINKSMSHYEVIMHLNSADATSGREFIFANFKGNIEAVNKWVLAKGYEIVETKPLHVRIP